MKQFLDTIDIIAREIYKIWLINTLLNIIYNKTIINYLDLSSVAASFPEGLLKRFFKLNGIKYYNNYTNKH